jgi:hypothetical protein
VVNSKRRAFDSSGHDNTNMNIIKNSFIASAMSISNIIKSATLVVLLTVTAEAQQIQSGTMVPLGGFVEDGAGNRYQVVLQPVAKPAPVVVAPAPVMAAPVVQQPQVVYVQQAAQPQGNAVGKYVGDTLVTGAGGAAQGAILGAVTGRNVGKEALGMGAGAAGGKVATDLINGIFKR